MHTPFIAQPTQFAVSVLGTIVPFSTKRHTRALVPTGMIQAGQAEAAVAMHTTSTNQEGSERNVVAVAVAVPEVADADEAIPAQRFESY